MYRKANFLPDHRIIRHFASGGNDEIDDTSLDSPVDKEGNKILYIGTQELVCRMMFFVTSFNFAYWTYYITNAWYYDGVTVTHMNIPLGGDPRWGFAGAFGTGLMVRHMI